MLPILQLEKVKTDGQKCRACPYISCARQKIQKHCRVEHGWANPCKRGGGYSRYCYKPK